VNADVSERGASTQERESWLNEPGIEILWTAALLLVFVILGYKVLPGFIRIFGKSGRTETVESALFLALGTAFPLAAAWAGRLSVKVGASRATATSAIAGITIACFALIFFRAMGAFAFGLSVLLSALIVGVAIRFSGNTWFHARPGWTVVVVLILTAVWEAVFRIASWTDAAGWTSQSVRTPVMMVVIVVLVTTIFTQPGSVVAGTPPRRFGFSWLDVPAAMIFLALSFRTTPIVEFLHWSFFVGPIESVRQGGWLLWDVPSQYGFLSLLLPSLLPTANAWQSLYLFQGVLYAITAMAIYSVITALRPGIISRIVAVAFTVGALFFRPRSFLLILPAQMTPSAGPIRFFWCYAILAVLFWKYRRGERVGDLKFAIVGTSVWVLSVAWSAESAIYTTVAWGGAYTIFRLQKLAAKRASDSNITGGRSRGLLAGLALPVIAIVVAVAVVALAYFTLQGHLPDWKGYYEFALLYSNGFGALPADVMGAVWYLVVLFIVASAIVVRFLVRDPSNPALVVAVGAWGTVWAISSYFVSRSHPANLLSLVPLLVFALVIAIHLLQSPPFDRWSGLLGMVAIPLVAMPTVLTLAHGGFPHLLFQQQSPMSRLTDQIPPMDSSLAQLATAAGMRAADPVFFVSDGRYVMPRWPSLNDAGAQTNSLAWMPKPYGMISLLPEARRNVYITRFELRARTGGWLVQKKSEINPAYESVLKLIDGSFTRTATFENDQWLMIRYQPNVRR